jgi:hypothetical protein
MATLPKFLIDCAKDKDIDPQKFAALVSAYHIEQAHEAELAFVAAFHKMQPDLPVVDERGEIAYRDGRTSTYALNEDEWAHIGKHRRCHTRGMAAEKRHTTTGSGMLCKRHHAAYDAHDFDLVPLDMVKGLDGAFRVVTGSSS